MDFLKILRSLEEFLYELMTWLLFYPRTMWRILRYPGATAHYAHHELLDKEDDQFIDAISPPLFLMLSVLLAHVVEVTSHSTMFTPVGGIVKDFFKSEQNLLLYRSIMYSIWPLVGASLMMTRRHEAIDRKTLRPAFFTQCYLAAPFAIAFSVGSAISRGGFEHALVIGNAVMLAAFCWYVVVQTIWFRQTLHVGLGAGLAHGLGACLGGLAINLVLLKIMTQ